MFSTIPGAARWITALLDRRPGDAAEFDNGGRTPLDLARHMDNDPYVSALEKAIGDRCGPRAASRHTILRLLT